ncbi:C-type lectin 37Db-like [Armigeres subalbatus]|uniref:C-type lectin 37Db-like n=1 Tax=Armigeres subalbatus TaxID=124917 RepID=UPI002ED38590
MAILRQSIFLTVLGLAASQELFCTAPSTFYIPLVKSNWYGAIEYCNRIGMRLAVVDSQRKQTEITQLAFGSHLFESDTEVTRADLWIGLNDLALEGRFIWHALGLGPVFTQWKKDEPNNLNQSEHCTHMWWQPTNNLFWDWNDDGCSREFNFVCENLKLA